jgi:hypothetical protein
LSGPVATELLATGSPDARLVQRSRAGLRWGKGFQAHDPAVVAQATRAAPWIDTLYILAAFAIMLGTIALLGALGCNLGFDIFPFGEDNNWIEMLQKGEGAGAARLFWALDWRNPLSPWWYIAARSIILSFEAGLLALRYATSLLLALSTYCLLLTVAGPRFRSFALGLAIAVVFWMPNGYLEQIFWNYEGALAFSLLSIAAYAQFLRSGRRAYQLYATSLVAFFIAFATYTIQCGAMLAVAYLALRRTPEHTPFDVKQSSATHSLHSPPPRGEGTGVGGARMGTDSAKRITPLPNPRPSRDRATQVSRGPQGEGGTPTSGRRRRPSLALALIPSAVAAAAGSIRIGRGLLTAATDTAPFVALFGLFLLIWQTTIHPAAVDAISLHFTSSGLLASLREGAWTSDFATFYRRLLASSDLIAIVAAAAVCSIIAFCALLLRRRWPGIEAAVIEIPRLVDVVVVLACVASPTVALESGSSIWTPGTRWPMIYHVTTPAFMLSVAALFLIMTTRASVRRYRLWIAAVSAVVGAGAAFSLAHNYWQIEVADNEKFVRDSLSRMVAEEFALGRNPPLQVLIMLDETSRSRWWSNSTRSQVIARAWLQRDDISFRLVNWYPILEAHLASWWAVRFGPDSEGVSNAKAWGGEVPYDRLRILEISGHTARRISVADRDTFKGWQVEWQRTGPITLPEGSSVPFCPVTWSADQDALSAGWSIAERDERGPFRWTTSRSARLTLPSDCRNRALLRVFAASALSTRNIDNLELDANGHKLQYRRMIADGEFVYEAELPAEIVGQKPLIDIDFAVSALDSFPNATRQFGIAIRRVEIRPADRPH